MADTATTGGKSSAYTEILSEANYLNTAIPTANTQAANYIAMSNIYLNTLAAGVDTFTNGQLDTITSLAVQCPYTAGDAVYLARSLYAQYDNTLFFDDLAICTSTSERSDRMLSMQNNSTDTISTPITTSEFIIVYPNPARNILEVFYSSNTNGAITFVLTDVMGQTVLSRPITNMSTIDLDVSNIASSLYLWKGMNGNLVVQTGKVSIQK